MKNSRTIKEYKFENSNWCLRKTLALTNITDPQFDGERNTNNCALVSSSVRLEEGISIGRI